MFDRRRARVVVAFVALLAPLTFGLSARGAGQVGTTFTVNTTDVVNDHVCNMARCSLFDARDAADVALLAGSAQAKPLPLPGVVTPSGNIRCFYVPARPAHLLCDIHRASYSRREQSSCMARSGLDWHGWEVYAARPTTTVCSGGILYNSNRNSPAYRRLAYGSTWHFAAFTCRSRITGLTCTTSSGHGVFLSRRSWRGW